MNFIYYFPQTMGIYKNKSLYTVDLGITGTFFSEKLTLALKAEDIFKGIVYRTNSVTNGIPQFFEGYYDNQAFSFTATYNFGNSKNQKQREVYDENKERID